MAAALPPPAMSHSSGIPASQQLKDAWGAARTEGGVRFLKVVVQDGAILRPPSQTPSAVSDRPGCEAVITPACFVSFLTATADQLVVAAKQPLTDNFDADYNAVAAHLQPKLPCYIVFRLDRCAPSASCRPGPLSGCAART